MACIFACLLIGAEGIYGWETLVTWPMDGEVAIYLIR